MTSIGESGMLSRTLPIGRRDIVRGALGTALASWLMIDISRLSAAEAKAGSTKANSTAPDPRDPVTVVIDDLVAAGHILSNENTSTLLATSAAVTRYGPAIS